VTEETGFKVVANTPLQTVQKMAEAMVCLAQDSGLREQMGAAGRKHVSENYGWRVVGERLDALYQKTANPVPVKI
jgi:glycosyltransferase involved in cell wall biosynthesis